jgi:hypothetical protein
MTSIVAYSLPRDVFPESLPSNGSMRHNILLWHNRPVWCKACHLSGFGILFYWRSVGFFRKGSGPPQCIHPHRETYKQKSYRNTSILREEFEPTIPTRLRPRSHCDRYRFRIEANGYKTKRFTWIRCHKTKFYSMLIDVCLGRAMRIEQW